MSITGGNSLFEQARDEGGIVDMFLDDIKDNPKKAKATPKGMKGQVVKHINQDIREAQMGIKRDRQLIQNLKSMHPR